MRFAPFQSVQEALTYGLLLLMLIVNIGGGIIMLGVIQQEKADTSTIEEQQLCFVTFFLQPNRTQITINNLQKCQPAIRQLR